MRKNKTFVKIILVILLAISPLASITSTVHANNQAQHSFEGAVPIIELFPDENLAKVVADWLGATIDQPVTASSLHGIYVIEASENDIQDITGVQFLTNAYYIGLSSNKFSDISPLSELDNLNNLDLNNNQISDVTALQKLKDVNISLNGNNISDLSSLKDVANVTATDQTIDLPDVPELEGTSLTLLDKKGNTPNHSFPDGPQIGSYDGKILTWNEHGQRQMKWNDTEGQFSGIVNQTVTPLGTISDFFPDVNLAARIANALFGNENINAPVTKEQLAGITNLHISRSPIENLTGMQHLKGLLTLNIEGAKIKDITPLIGLTNLVTLDLSNNQIVDIDVLSSLTGLRNLYLDDNQIKDISALSKLNNLSNLSLDSNEIEDVTALSNLNNLQSLYLSDNRISDISTLPVVSESSNFRAVNQTVTLEMGYIGVPQNITLLNQRGEVPSTNITVGEGSFVNGKLTWTSTPDTKENRLTWTGPMNFTGILIQKVDSQPTIYDLFEDNNLARAIALKLNNSEANALVFPSQLEEIEYLYISGNNISNLSGMHRLTGLKYLHASSNNISDISPLKELTALETLNLNNNIITDISALEDLSNLVELSLNNNRITDISVLSGDFDDLERLTARNQNIQLESVFTGMATSIVLLDEENVVPETNMLGKGSYDEENKQLTWTTAGKNYLQWQSKSNFFTGILGQEVSTGNEQNITIDSIFPDKNLALAVAEDLEKTTDSVVTSDELNTITNLNLYKMNVVNLSGIQYLTRLRILFAPNNEIKDITYLGELSNLRSLYLTNNQIEDISILANLNGLIHLDLNNNKISDVTPLAKLSLSLDALRIDGNHVSDISSISANLGNSARFSARNQVINLPQVKVGEATKLSILNSNGDIPNITFNEEEGGRYSEGELTWSKAGENSFSWSGPTSFTGRVFQTVISDESDIVKSEE